MNWSVTIHTNSAVKTIGRLIDMGIDTFLVGSSLSGIVAQRLVRHVCTVCGRTESPTADEQAIFERNGFSDIKKVKRSSCNTKVYKGRVAVFEILVVNEKIARMISNHEKEYDILEQAQKDVNKHMYHFVSTNILSIHSL